MGAEVVVPIARSREDVIEVAFVEDEHAIQNFGLNCLDDPLNVSPQVWGTGRHLGDFNARLAEDLIETRWVLHVVVAQQDRQREIGE